MRRRAIHPDRRAHGPAPDHGLRAAELCAERDFREVVDLRRRISAVAREYAELDRLSASLYSAATDMSRGVMDLRRVKQQLDFIREVSTSQDITDKGEALNEQLDEWIAKLLQKELKTFQNAYQQEARLLMKFKDLLGRMGGANIPVTDGVKEVTADYLQEWSGIEVELQLIKSRDIPAFNMVLREAGLPEIYLPRPVT